MPVRFRTGFLIGSTRDRVGGSAFDLRGAIDEVVLYDYALPPARILAHCATAYAPPSPPFLAIDGSGEIIWPDVGSGFTLQFAGR